MLLLVGGDQDVVLVLPLLPRPVLEGGDPVAVLPVVEPLPLVLQPVRPENISQYLNAKNILLKIFCLTSR